MTILNKARARAKKLNKGFTLTEIAIVLGIMGLILGAIWVAAAGVYNNQRVNQGNTAVLQVLQAVRNLYSQGGSMATGDQSANLVSSGAIPTNLVSAGNMVTPWGTSMFVGADNTAGYVDIELSGMTASLCTGLVMQVFGTSHDRTLDTASVVGGPTNNLATFAALTANKATFSASVNPIANGSNVYATPSAAGTACSPSVSTNTMKLAFALQG